jgi:hypothetical protein
MGGMGLVGEWVGGGDGSLELVLNSIESANENLNDTRMEVLIL